MIKKLLYILMIGLLVSQYSYGQDTRKATLTVNATATVTDNLQMLTIRNLDLINPIVVENQILVSPITSSYAGMFKITGNRGARVRITFLQTELLEEQNGGRGTVFAQYSLSAARDDIQFQSALLDVGEAVVPIGATGELYVWLGANLDLSKATPGLYLSEFTIELEYI
ncbi:hypothetical protein [Rhodonellum sp.]|uniref:hypothetical protein n=1 Tax=Rhodonellum sp. TaxID=2231180 RepID=UPI0027257CBA|nr:hypothetical protein [Rhodonellum sp.]MDO9552163.1 hypothetical protein [Rhodonellum sp.]